MHNYWNVSSSDSSLRKPVILSCFSPGQWFPDNFRIARDSGRNAEERYDLGTNPPPPSDGYPTQLPTRGERCTAAYLPLLDSGAFATQNKPQRICPDQAGIFNS